VLSAVLTMVVEQVCWTMLDYCIKLAMRDQLKSPARVDTGVFLKEPSHRMKRSMHRDSTVGLARHMKQASI
jgi:hypothetical protein